MTGADFDYGGVVRPPSTGADWSDLGTPERLKTWLEEMGRYELSNLVR